MGPGKFPTRTGEPSEDEIYGILNALTSFGQIGADKGGLAGAGAFHQQMSELPGNAQVTLKEANSGIPSTSKTGDTVRYTSSEVPQYRE